MFYPETPNSKCVTIIADGGTLCFAVEGYCFFPPFFFRNYDYDKTVLSVLVE